MESQVLSAVSHVLSTYIRCCIHDGMKDIFYQTSKKIQKIHCIVCCRIKSVHETSRKKTNRLKSTTVNNNAAHNTQTS